MEALKKPVLITEKDLDELLEQIWPGGTTIVENRASLGIEFALHAFIQYSKKKGIPLIVEDIFDTLPVYMTHLRLMGVRVNDSDVKVIKVGGTQETGDVIAKIKFGNDPYVYQEKIDRELRKITGDSMYVHLVLGLERLLVLQGDVRSIYTLMGLIKQKLGDERRINLYLVETPIIETLDFNPLPMLEDLATSVIELQDEDELIDIKLKKSVFTLLMHRDHLLVSPREILRWWM